MAGARGVTPVLSLPWPVLIAPNWTSAAQHAAAADERRGRTSGVEEFVSSRSRLSGRTLAGLFLVASRHSRIGIRSWADGYGIKSR